MGVSLYINVIVWDTRIISQPRIFLSLSLSFPFSLSFSFALFLFPLISLNYFSGRQVTCKQKNKKKKERTDFSLLQDHSRRKNESFFRSGEVCKGGAWSVGLVQLARRRPRIFRFACGYEGVVTDHDGHRENTILYTCGQF